MLLLNFVALTYVYHDMSAILVRSQTFLPIREDRVVRDAVSFDTLHGPPHSLFPVEARKHSFSWDHEEECMLEYSKSTVRF